MEDKIVLISATGRSGSTTMQRIINTIPNSNICGENYGAINSVLDFYNKLHTTSREQVPGHYNPASYEDIVSKNVKPSWYNSYKMSEMEDQIRKLIITMFKNKPETNLWGFKEIRYDNKKINLIKFFKTLFPQTKVIIQIRENVQAQSKSGWHKDDKNAPAYLQQMNKELIEFYNQNKDWCYFTTFERMFDRNNLQNIFSFIDCRENYDENKVTEVLNNNIKD
jgi:predicted PolB exonuclease-like 3'-5' exonuclease